MALTAQKIKDSLGTLLNQKCSLNSIPAESLVPLVQDSGQAKYVKHRCFSTLLMRKIWKKRFVVLVNTAMYIYDHDTSKRPRNCISLKGYNRIHRVESNKSQWAFAVASDDGVLEDIAFDCSTDKERREWMRKIKNSLYKANDKGPRKLSLAEHLVSELKGSESNQELEYEILEEPVYEMNLRKTRAESETIRDSVFTTESDFSDDDDECKLNDYISEDESSYEVGIWCRLKRKGAIKRRKTGVSSESGEERMSVKL